nr:KilA-N domain-containing protein [Butyricimonas synergistica]
MSLWNKRRYGGTFAHKDIAFEFGSAISVPFKLYTHQCHQAQPCSGRSHFGAGKYYLRQRNRRVERGNIRHDSKAIAGRQSLIHGQVQ